MGSRTIGTCRGHRVLKLVEERLEDIDASGADGEGGFGNDGVGGLEKLETGQVVGGKARDELGSLDVEVSMRPVGHLHRVVDRRRSLRRTWPSAGNVLRY